MRNYRGISLTRNTSLMGNYNDTSLMRNTSLIRNYRGTSCIRNRLVGGSFLRFLISEVRTLH